MIRLKNHAEIGKIREAGFILSETLEKLKAMVEVGIPTAELDNFARDYIRSRGGEPAFLGYMNFPASVCISINHEVIHGIPGKTRLKNGDIVGLDLGVNLGGYYADAAVTIPVGQVSAAREHLIRVARECLELGIEQAVYGNRISHISRAIYDHARSNSFEVVRQYCGHGVGFSQHEEPQIPNYVSSGPNPSPPPGRGPTSSTGPAATARPTAGDPETAPPAGAAATAAPGATASIASAPRASLPRCSPPTRPSSPWRRRTTTCWSAPARTDGSCRKFYTQAITRHA